MSSLKDPLNKKLVEEDCLDWDDGPDEELGLLGDEERDDQSLCVAVCTLVAAVPALIGSWCWPILVGAIFAVAAGNVNGGLVDFFHGVQVAIMFGLMTNIMQFAWWKVKGKKHLSYCMRMRPVFILTLATVCVCFQPVCMLVIGSWDSIDNFFFDGSDAGQYCSGIPNEITCKSGACLSSPFDGPGLVKNHMPNPVPELDYLWTTTGCKPIPTGNWTSDEGAGTIITAVYGSDDVESVAAKFFDACGTDTWLGSLCAQQDKSKCVDTTKDPNVVAINNAGDGSFGTCFPYNKAFPVVQPNAENPIPLCVCQMNSQALVPNTTVGWCIQIFGTYFGFLLMFWGVFEATGLHTKIMRKWKRLRG